MTRKVGTASAAACLNGFEICTVGPVTVEIHWESAISDPAGGDTHWQPCHWIPTERKGELGTILQSPTNDLLRYAGDM